MMSTGCKNRTEILFYKKNSRSILSCVKRTKEIKRTKEGCDHVSKVGTVHSRRERKGPVPMRKSKESDRRRSCEKDYVSRK